MRTNKDSPSFYEILEARVRTDLRKEIETEVRAELKRPVSSIMSSPRPFSETSDPLETWLASRLSTTFFFADNTRARRTYRASTPRSGTTQTRINDQDTTQATAEKASRRASATSAADLCRLELFRRHGASIATTFSENDLRRAWHKAALQTHPDRFAQDDAVTQARMATIFRELADAYADLQAKFNIAANAA